MSLDSKIQRSMVMVELGLSPDHPVDWRVTNSRCHAQQDGDDQMKARVWYNPSLKCFVANGIGRSWSSKVYATGQTETEALNNLIRSIEKRELARRAKATSKARG